MHFNLVIGVPVLEGFLKVLGDTDFCFSDAGIEKQLENTGKNRPVLEGSNTLAIANHFRRSDFPMQPAFFKKRHWRLQQTERRTPEGETPEQNIPNLSDALFHKLKNMNSHRSDGLFNGQHRFPKSPATVSQKRKSEGSKMERPSKGKLIH